MWFREGARGPALRAHRWRAEGVVCIPSWVMSGRVHRVQVGWGTEGEKLPEARTCVVSPGGSSVRAVMGKQKYSHQNWY